MSVYYTPRHQNYNTVHMWKVFSKPYTLPSRHYHYTREYFRQYYASSIHLCTLLVVTNSPCSISFLPGTTVTTVQFWLLLSEPYIFLPRHYLHYCLFLVNIQQGLYPSSQALPLPWCLFLVTIFKHLHPSSQEQQQIYGPFWPIFSNSSFQAAKL